MKLFHSLIEGLLVGAPPTGRHPGVVVSDRQPQQQLPQRKQQQQYYKQRTAISILAILFTALASTCKCQFLSSNSMPFPQQQPPLNSPYFYDESVQVSTRLGNIIGKTVYLFDGPYRSPFERASSQLYAPPNTWQRPTLPNYYRNVSLFLGIPYARPPRREFGLRFQLPQAIGHFGQLAADKYRPACPQPLKYTGQDRGISMTDEDCLYLNIFTPYARPRASKLFPVIMHIHGGKFEHGSGNAFPGHMLAASQEVVVVTFNYRLGVLGYMATADNSSAGNYGLADQIAALQWVRDHIENFNGDPQMITLWGTGSGAASAGLLAVSPRSRDMVKRVIAQSGSAMADWALQENPLFVRNTSIVVGEHFGCFSRDSFSLIKCLESRSFNEFTTVDVESEVGWLTFSPVLDYKTRDRDFAIVPESPEQYLNLPYSRFNDGFAYMSGVTRDEGSAWLLEDEEVSLKGFVVDQTLFKKKVWSYIKIFNVTRNQLAFADAIDFMYSPWNDRANLSNFRQGLIDMLTDSWVVAGHDKIVKHMLKKDVPTYAYVLNYTIESLIQPEPWMGVPHDTEYFLLSGAPFLDAKYFPSFYNLKDVRWTEMDRNMSQFFMEAYANFAKYGNPTPYALFNNILWQPVRQDNLQYLSVNTTNFTTVMARDYRLKSAQFWNDYIYTLFEHEPIYWTSAFTPVDMELRAYKASAYAILVLAIILLFLTILCSCLYCRARRDRYGDSSIDYMPVPNEAGVLMYGPPSKRVNSQTLTKLPLSIQSQYNNPQQQTRHMKYHQTQPRGGDTRPKTPEKIPTMNDRHTLV
jgi:neuroligin